MLNAVLAADASLDAVINTGFLSDLTYGTQAGIGGAPDYWSTWSATNLGNWSTNLGLATAVNPSGLGADILALHDTAGNRAVSQLVQPGTLAQPVIQRQCKACNEGGHKCAHCQKEEEHTIRRQANSPGVTTPSTIPASVQAALARTGGQALPGTVRADLEQRFNRDFGQVRIHTDPVAAQAADDIDAAAFTLGQSIWFAPGRYQPQTQAGMHLLSHELANTVQQGAQPGSVQKQSLTVGKVNDPLEAAADLVPPMPFSIMPLCR